MNTKRFTIELIADERFNQTKEDVLSQLEKVKVCSSWRIVNIGQVRELNWPKSGLEAAHKQWRIGVRLNSEAPKNELQVRVNLIRAQPISFK